MNETCWICGKIVESHPPWYSEGQYWAIPLNDGRVITGYIHTDCVEGVLKRYFEGVQRCLPPCSMPNAPSAAAVPPCLSRRR